MIMGMREVVWPRMKAERGAAVGDVNIKIELR